MSDTSKARRVFLLGNPTKPEAAAALDEIRNFAGERCNVVGAELGLDGRAAIDARADRLVVLGGDGTLIGVARSLGARQIPLIGVNTGKLGFLTEFATEDLKANFDRIITDDDLISRRTAIEVTIRHDGGTRKAGLAINDCVIQAGPPFRMIRLGISIDGQHLTEVAGDGIIICTPSGSTAHNLSAGGPLMQPGVPAIILTPVCPHSLTHKPLVVESAATIEIEARDVNEGTTAIIDGQVSCPLKPGDRVTIRRFDTDFQLVRNPLYTRWHNLVTKLHWGQSPTCD